MAALKLTKTKSAQAMGIYSETSLDRHKKTCDFLLTSVGKKNRIVWVGGESQYVTDRQLEKLQKNHSWAADF